jgi:hypothetical protein
MIMGRSRGEPKSILLGTMVVSRIRDHVIQLADREGLNTSEWIRSLILTELKKNNSIPKQIREPIY